MYVQRPASRLAREPRVEPGAVVALFRRRVMRFWIWRGARVTARAPLRALLAAVLRSLRLTAGSISTVQA